MKHSRKSFRTHRSLLSKKTKKIREKIIRAKLPPDTTESESDIDDPSPENNSMELQETLEDLIALLWILSNKRYMPWLSIQTYKHTHGYVKKNHHIGCSPHLFQDVNKRLPDSENQHYMQLTRKLTWLPKTSYCYPRICKNILNLENIFVHIQTNLVLKGHTSWLNYFP